MDHGPAALIPDEERHRQWTRHHESIYGLSNGASPLAPTSQFASAVLLTLVVFLPFIITNWLFDTYGSDAIVLALLVFLVIASRFLSVVAYSAAQRQLNVHWETWVNTISTYFTTSFASVASQYGLRILSQLWTQYYDTVNIFFVLAISIAFLCLSFAWVQRLKMDADAHRQRELMRFQQRTKTPSANEVIL